MLNATTLLALLWRASWQAGLLAGLVLALRYTLRDRLPAAWRCRLWGLVFVRLLLPALPNSPLSLFNLVPADPPLPAAIHWQTVTVVVRANAAVVPSSAESAPTPPPVPTPSRLPEILLTTWLAVAGTLVFVTVTAHVRFARRVRRSQQTVPPAVTDGWQRAAAGRRVPPIVVTEAVSSPALFGLVRGRLLLPPNLWDRLSAAELTLVFRHELAHVRRRDLAIGWLTVLIRCVYWFHPLVWVAVAARRSDAEAACDEAVVAGTGDRLAYGRTLLAVAGGRRVPALGMADGRTDLRRRLARIATARRAGPWSVAIAAALTAAVGCATLTGAKPSENVTRTYDLLIPYESEAPVATDGGSEAKGFTPVLPLSPTRPQTPSQMADLVRRTVTPDAWQRPGTAITFDGRFKMQVTAPPETQAGVAQLVAGMGYQVTVETRVMTVRPEQARSLGIEVPDAGVILPVTAEQVTGLIRLAERDRDATTLTAPRMTLYNGQVSRLIVETRQAYVSDLTPVFAPGGASLVDPTVSTIPATGLSEQIRATVTADGGSVDLTAHFEMRQLRSMEPVDVAYTRAGQTIHGTLQLPHVHVTRTDPTVRIASKTSVLLRAAESDTLGADHPTTRRSTAPSGDRLTIVLIRPTVLGPWKGPEKTAPPATHATASRVTPDHSGIYGRPGTSGPFLLSDYPSMVMAPVARRTSGPYPVPPGMNGAGRSIMATATPPSPGTPTPDGRGVVMPIPTSIPPDVVQLSTQSHTQSSSPKLWGSRPVDDR